VAGAALLVAALLALGGEAGAATQTFRPVADSFTTSAAPKANRGGSTVITVDGSPTLRGFLRFDVRGLTEPVRSATLRLHSYSSSGTGVRVHPVASNSWGERTITHANAPPIGSAAGSSGAFSAGQSVRIDVSSLVAGNGLESFAVTTTSTSSKNFSSREGLRPPELVVDTESPPPPPPPPGDPVIAAAGDIACAPTDPDYNGGAGTASRCHQKAVSDLMVGSGLSAVLPLGDLQYEKGELANFQQAFDPSWGRLGDLLRPIPGNHEYGTPGAAGYFDYFNGPGNFTGPAGRRDQGYYSYDLGTWHLIALNSMCSAVGGCGPGSPQEQWLRSDLAANPSDCTLAYMHHPLYTSDPRGGATNVRPLWEALYQAGADVVLSGHHHGYERFARQDPYGASDRTGGIREFVVGTGGKEVNAFGQVVPNSGVRNDTTHGVIELSLADGSYDWQFVPEGGQGFTDSGSDLCDGAMPDAVAPSAPTGLTAAPNGSGGVSVSWRASTDNDGVSEYRVFRDGEQIGTSTRTTYIDDAVQPGTTYAYEVVAADPAGNASPRSQTSTVTTPGEGELVLTPTDDATVRSDDPSSAYGARTYLETDNGPVRHFLLKFGVEGTEGRQIESATLRLHATNPSSTGGDVRAVADDAWNEQTITWANAPPAADSSVGSIGPVATGNWYAVDVTALVTGDGPASMRVTSSSSDGADYSSTEGAAALAPQLHIRTGG
jgi:chitodextrinase